MALVELDGVEHGFYAHLETRAEEGDHARAHCAGRAGARHIRHVDADVALYDLGEVPQALIEEFDHFGVCALLRPEYVCRAGFAVHGVVYVAHGDYLDLVEGGSRMDMSMRSNVFERASDGDKALAGGVVELNSCRSRRAAAAVVRGAAAQAYYKALGPAARRIGQQLSNAKGRGAARVLVSPTIGRPAAAAISSTAVAPLSISP